MLDKLVSQRDTLLPDESSFHRLVVAATAEIQSWEAGGINVHAFFDSDYPRNCMRSGRCHRYSSHAAG